MKPFNEKDGYKVWLNDEEAQVLIETMKERGGTNHEIAVRLGLHCGLRRDEAAQSRPVDVVEDMGEMNLRVWEDQAKRDKYRETPIPRDLADKIRMLPELNPDKAIGDPVLTVTAKTLNRWVQRACEELHTETGDEGWLHVSYHDLRRTWGTRMLESGVLPSVVMYHGGWEDWETFREHYLGEFSPHALQRERSKVPWLTGRGDGRADAETHLTPVSNPPWQSDRATYSSE